MKHIFLIISFFRRICRYAVLFGMIAVMVSSCGGSKKSSSMRQIEKHSKKNPIGEDGLPVVTLKKEGKKVRETKAKQQKQQAAADKEAEKAYKDAITRHRSLQTPEMRVRMDQHLKESNKKYSNKKEFFLVRWFRPKDDIEKIEKRQAKETQKRMAATRKKSEKTNKEFGITSITKTKDRQARKPNPKDMPQGGGGVYKEGSASKYARPSDMQQGGGGSYSESKSKNKVKASDFQQGGGGTYKEGKSEKNKKASDVQQGGGGKMSKKSKKTKEKK